MQHNHFQEQHFSIRPYVQSGEPACHNMRRLRKINTSDSQEIHHYTQQSVKCNSARTQNENVNPQNFDQPSQAHPQYYYNKQGGQCNWQRGNYQEKTPSFQFYPQAKCHRANGHDQTAYYLQNSQHEFNQMNITGAKQNMRRSYQHSQSGKFGPMPIEGFSQTNESAGFPLDKLEQVTNEMFAGYGEPMYSPTSQSTQASSQYEGFADQSTLVTMPKAGESDQFQPQISLQQPVLAKNSSEKRSTMSEGTWKVKVKTEFCRFWLRGQTCENSQKEQGCGFAHGAPELQRKKNLNKQYLTSVCKNFLDHPSKCTYGSRCIFQHPTYDVKKRIPYSAMMQDNQRYTAMRLFQDIEQAKTVYINTYAATTPRLSVFKGICNSNAQGPELCDEEDLGIEADFAKINVNLQTIKSAHKTRFRPRIESASTSDCSGSERDSSIESLQKQTNKQASCANVFEKFTYLNNVQEFVPSNTLQPIAVAAM